MKVRVVTMAVIAWLCVAGSAVFAQTPDGDPQRGDVLRTKQGRFSDAAAPVEMRPGVASTPGAMAAAPARAPAIAAPAAAPSQWAIEATDVRLVDTFTRWAKKAGIQLRWDATRHVELGATDMYEGDIQEAMIAALKSPSIYNSDHPLEVCFYPNRPMLARITRRGEQWRDCPLIQPPSVAATYPAQK